MSTKEIISEIQALPLSERISVLEEIVNSIKTEIKTSKKITTVDKHNKEIQWRRRAYRVEVFDLGGDIVVDRNEIYSERGI